LPSENPLEQKHSLDGEWRDMVATRLKKLKKLDGKLQYYRLIIVIFVIKSNQIERSFIAYQNRM